MTRDISGRARVVVLAVTLLTAGWLVAAGGGAQQRTTWRGDSAAGAPTPPPLAAPTSTVSGRLGDGTPYDPLLYLDLDVSFGSAPSGDGTAKRLLRRGSDGVEELRRLPKDVSPEYLGLTVSDDVLYWVEHILADDGKGLSIWRAPVDGIARPDRERTGAASPR